MTINVFGIKYNIRKEMVIAFAVVGFIAAAAAGYLLSKGKKELVFEASEGNPALQEISAAVENTAAADDTADIVKEEQEIKIYVVGCVRNPGIVTLAKGQLVADAVAAAGGLTEEADPEAINMVFALEENTMLLVKAREELESRGEDAAGRGAELISDDRGAAVGMGASNKSAGAKININRAGSAELETLPGIGEATAGEIIAFREANGPFNTISDIMKVPRIKEGRFQSIKDLITVD